jgi:hypothetical protein
MPWDIPRSRKVYLAVLVAVTAVAAWFGYERGVGGQPRLTYEQQCKAICGSLPSQIKKTYIDQLSPESRRNMPRTVECLCGSSTVGKLLF